MRNFKCRRKQQSKVSPHLFYKLKQFAKKNMRKNSILFAVLFLVFTASHISAQDKTAKREAIIIEFQIPNRDYFDKVRIPINSKEEFGETSISECGIPEKCPDFVYSTYTLSAKVVGKSNRFTKINFKIEVTDGCQTQKVFTVYRNKKTTFRLNCGVTLNAYYGLESEEGN